MEGKIKAALRHTMKRELDSIVSTTGNTPAKTVRDVSLEKHSSAKPLVPSAVCDATPEPHRVHFDQIDGPLIRSIALKIAGPSGINAAGWKPIYVILSPLSPKESAQPIC